MALGPFAHALYTYYYYAFMHPSSSIYIRSTGDPPVLVVPLPGTIYVYYCLCSMHSSEHGLGVEDGGRLVWSCGDHESRRSSGRPPSLHPDHA